MMLFKEVNFLRSKTIIKFLIHLEILECFVNTRMQNSHALEVLILEMGSGKDEYFKFESLAICDSL